MPRRQIWRVGYCSHMDHSSHLTLWYSLLWVGGGHVHLCWRCWDCHTGALEERIPGRRNACMWVIWILDLRSWILNLRPFIRSWIQLKIRPCYSYTTALPCIQIIHFAAYTKHIWGFKMLCSSTAYFRIITLQLFCITIIMILTHRCLY